MHATIRSYATASAAIAAAGVIAVTPVAPPVPEALARTASPTVELTAFDPLTPWLEVFNDSEVNIAGLVNYFFDAPFPVAQQVTSNWIYYIGHLSQIGESLEQIGKNAVAAVQAPFVADQALLDATHKGLYTAIAGLLPDYEALLSFAASPTSGLLMGLLGPAISPLLALSDSIQATFTAIQEGAWEDALNSLINIPAAMTGAFLNGYGTLNLEALIPLIQPELPLGTLTELNLAMGGLLSPAGSLFNSVGMKVKSGPITLLSATGVPAGFFGTLLATGQAIAKAIGWDGEGNPLAPPLTPPYGESTPGSADEVPASITDPDATVVTVSQDEDTAPDQSAVGEDAEGAEEDVTAGSEDGEEAATDAEGTAETETTDAGEEAGELESVDPVVSDEEVTGDAVETDEVAAEAADGSDNTTADAGDDGADAGN
ncbi:MAG: outer membrane porin GjpA, partial [Mycobacterium sp.]|nr:outer membrane porin GjpA [Mycobacterium sp.]